MEDDDERLKEMAERASNPSLRRARWLHYPVTQRQFDALLQERNDARTEVEKLQRFVEQIRSTRESAAFAPPEMQDHWWNRVDVILNSVTNPKPTGGNDA